MEKDEWLTVQQVAEELGVSRQWVWRRVVDGRIRARAYLAGARWTYRISRAAVTEFIKHAGRDTAVNDWDLE